MNIWPYISLISFWSAYGDSGLVGIVSVFGSTSVSPYTDDEPAKTRRFTPLSRDAISICSMPSTLARCDSSGLSTERGTEGMAA